MRARRSSPTISGFHLSTLVIFAAVASLTVTVLSASATASATATAAATQTPAATSTATATGTAIATPTVTPVPVALAVSPRQIKFGKVVFGSNASNSPNTVSLVGAGIHPRK